MKILKEEILRTRSKYYSRIPSTVLDQVNFPSALGVSDKAFDLYLLDVISANKHTGNAFPGYPAASNLIGIKSKEEFNSLKEELLNNGLEEKVAVSFNSRNPGGKAQEYLILYPYLYSDYLKKYTGNHKVSNYTFNKPGMNFLMFPDNLIRGKHRILKTLSYPDIIVMFQMYQALELGKYGGVNPEMFRYDKEKGTYWVNDILKETTGFTDEFYASAINKIMKKKIFSITPMILQKKEFINWNNKEQVYWEWLATVPENKIEQVMKHYGDRATKSVYVLTTKYIPGSETRGKSLWRQYKKFQDRAHQRAKRLGINKARTRNKVDKASRFDNGKGGVI